MSVAQSFNLQGVPQQVATTLYDGSSPQQQLVNYTLDSYNNLTEKDESDYYQCTSPCTPPATASQWLRKTFTTYQYQSVSSWVTAHIERSRGLGRINNQVGVRLWKTRCKVGSIL
jgi:hypothetical protein